MTETKSETEVADLKRDAEETPLLEDRGQHRLRVLFIGSVWPEKGSSAAGLRSENLIDACLDASMDVTYASAAAFNTWSDRLEQKGCSTWRVTLNDSSFNDELKQRSPDIVVYDRFLLEEQFGARVRETLPRAVEWIDTQDLHSVRKWRMEHDTPFPPQSDTLFLREIGALLRVDKSLILSDEECAFLNSIGIPKAKYLHSPFWFPEQPQPSNLPTFQEREDFLFIGNFRHPPNPHGLQWLIENVWPHVHSALPNARLKICGAYPPKSVKQWDQPQKGLKLIGPVPLEEAPSLFASTRVNLAPLLFGAGLKGKIAEGWFFRTPVVSTSIGLEGYRSHPIAGIEANTPKDFAQAMIDLYCSAPLWAEASLKTEAFFEPSSGLLAGQHRAQSWISSIKKSYQTAQSHREQDFLGNLLRLESINSARYFSRWLEAKNRLNNPEKSV